MEITEDTQQMGIFAMVVIAILVVVSWKGCEYAENSNKRKADCLKLTTRSATECGQL